MFDLIEMILLRAFPLPFSRASAITLSMPRMKVILAAEY